MMNTLEIVKTKMQKLNINKVYFRDKSEFLLELKNDKLILRRCLDVKNLR